MTPLHRFIEHTLLKPEATAAEVERLCAEAVGHDLLGACVAPVHVARAAAALRGSPVRLVSVVGFPHGTSASAIKAAEAEAAAAEGAAELDMVIALGALRAGDRDAVRADIAAVVRVGRPTKVILETGLLTEEEKVLACELARDAGAAFVKTSTGFGPGGATAPDVALMRRAAAPLEVKASGGIRTREQALALLAAGATRLGTSSSLALIG